MMLMPRRNDFDLWDDIFNDPFFTSSKPVVKNMKTDIIEKDNAYQVDIDLPGFDKNDLKISVEDGYLTVTAKKEQSSEEKKDGSYIRRERYSGECSRTFFVGEEYEAEDIKASFKNGILSLDIPKKEEKKEKPEKKYIEIDD